MDQDILRVASFDGNYAGKTKAFQKMHNSENQLSVSDQGSGLTKN